MTRQLPVDIQDFETLRNENYIYVDKTQLIHRMITKGRVYFLSRPRRFGKSLLISTLKAIFQGKKHLFQDLWIDKSDYTWEQHPVIWLDMSAVENESAALLRQSLNEQLEKIAAQYDIELASSVSVAGRLDNLILQLSKDNKKVVVLIDEYDSPLIEQIHQPTIAAGNQNILKKFYSILKVRNANLRFVFLTGVSKFSRVSIFSGLNNLRDISLQPTYATLLGYTQEELTDYFELEIDSLAQKEGLSRQEILDKIKHWYNGYRFSEEDVSVYNPFSTLWLFDQQKFANYWFRSATPTFLVKFIQQRHFNVTNIEHRKMEEDEFSTYEIDELKIEPLLYQTGYLTIKAYHPASMSYELGFPNKEVEMAFLKSLLNYFSKVDQPLQSDILINMVEALGKRDFEVFVQQLQAFLASIPYDLVAQGERETFYQTIFFLVFKLMGLQVDVEVHTNLGRIDAVIKDKVSILIFELKVNQSAQEALAQIKTKGYADQYRHQQKAVYLIGLNFNSTERNVDDYMVEQLA